MDDDTAPPHRSGMLARRDWRPGVAWGVLGPLLAVDAALIGLHGILGLTLPTVPDLFHIARETSLAEAVGYGKWAVSAILLALCALRGGGAVALAFAAVLTLMLADDGLQFHETLGHRLSRAAGLGELGAVDAQSLGEVIVLAAFGAALAPAILWSVWTAPPQGRWMALRLTGLIAVFALFGGVFDALHAPFEDWRYGAGIADLIEDGGEMAVASVITAHVVFLWRDGARSGGASGRRSAPPGRDPRRPRPGRRR
ncbi:hypothetical protein DXV76_02160 [Rhodobacteraceae bacterium CCMM004]|nr:hypothetical protein DXV76_02160 [Rhodobacteraceae bacterium CCMM004]